MMVSAVSAESCAAVTDEGLTLVLHSDKVLGSIPSLDLGSFCVEVACSTPVWLF